MTRSIALQREKTYGAHNYEPLPVVLTRGQGVTVWDEHGHSYLDMMSAYSAVSHGHCHPRIVETLKQQASTLGIVSRAFYSDQLGIFLEKACVLLGYESALPMNTGAEAVETALKAARKWAYTVKGVARGKAEMISCTGNFHGRTIAIVGLSSEEQYRDGFEPFPAGSKLIPYGDIDALEKAITPNTAAFLVEPIQGEGGIVVPPAGYLKACQAICRKHNVLLICDEIQTGLGRTGAWLASAHDDIKPDAITLGKALGGGMFPVSLFMARREIMDVFTPGDHGSTFGGNPLAAAIAYEALCILEDEHLILRAQQLGDYFIAKLKSVRSSLIKEVRGKGLLIGVEIVPHCPAKKLCLKLLERGILTKETHHTVLRFAPPLIVETGHIDYVVESLQAVCAELETEMHLA